MVPKRYMFSQDGALQINHTSVLAQQIRKYILEGCVNTNLDIGWTLGEDSWQQ